MDDGNNKKIFCFIHTTVYPANPNTSNPPFTTVMSTSRPRTTAKGMSALIAARSRGDRRAEAVIRRNHFSMPPRFHYSVPPRDEALAITADSRDSHRQAWAEFNPLSKESTPEPPQSQLTHPKQKPKRKRGPDEKKNKKKPKKKKKMKKRRKKKPRLSETKPTNDEHVAVTSRVMPTVTSPRTTDNTVDIVTRETPVEHPVTIPDPNAETEKEKKKQKKKKKTKKKKKNKKTKKTKKKKTKKNKHTNQRKTRQKTHESPLPSEQNEARSVAGEARSTTGDTLHTHNDSGTNVAGVGNAQTSADEPGVSMSAEQIAKLRKQLEAYHERAKKAFDNAVDTLPEKLYERQDASASAGETSTTTARCSDSRHRTFLRRSTSRNSGFEHLTRSSSSNPYGRLSQSQAKKHKTVLYQLFSFFSAAPNVSATLTFREEDGFPESIPADVLELWIQYLLTRNDLPGQEMFPGFKTNTVLSHCRNNVVDLLNRMNVTIPQNAKKIMLDKIHLMVRRSEVSRKQMTAKGQEALTRCDAKHMFDHIPHGMVAALELKALASIGITSGLRGVSLRSLRWDDITLKSVPNTPMYQVTIKVNKSKGIREAFYRTFEGTLTDNSPINVVYHLTQHLREQVRRKNATLRNGHLALYSLIFPHRQDQYNNWLREISVRCGYPSHIRFTVHSFRAGFLFECVARAANTETAFRNGSIIAGWTLSDASCIMMYIKKCLESVLSCTRVVNGNKIDTFDVKESDAKNLIRFTGERAVMLNFIDDPEALHHISFRPIVFTRLQKLQLFDAELTFGMRHALKIMNTQHRAMSTLKSATIAQIYNSVVCDAPSTTNTKYFDSQSNSPINLLTTKKSSHSRLRHTCIYIVCMVQYNDLLLRIIILAIVAQSLLDFERIGRLVKSTTRKFAQK